MKANNFVIQIKSIGINNIIGIPDSALKPFCDYINGNKEEEVLHYVPANEGAAVGLAIGNYLATGKPSCLYMQNSGIGNIVNPITSLANEKVYGIPMLLLIGWRGEPGVHDEPQHQFMGEITEKILQVLDIEYKILSSDTSEKELLLAFQRADDVLKKNRQFAFVIRKGFFTANEPNCYQNGYPFIREQAIKEIITTLSENDILVSTTGKISREVYEQSNMINNQHSQNFLTVGGMGHASMIALGIAKKKMKNRIYCLDGDGAVLMHMGSLAFIAKQNPNNFIHVCLNNEAHESVGGMPTGAAGIKYAEVAKACGYPVTYTVDNLEELQKILKEVHQKNQLTFIEIKVSIQSRSDLGRPKETALENRINFMKYHGVVD